MALASVTSETTSTAWASVCLVVCDGTIVFVKWRPGRNAWWTACPTEFLQRPDHDLQIRCTGHCSLQFAAAPTDFLLRPDSRGIVDCRDVSHTERCQRNLDQI